jgi:hypothetical protein
MDVFVANHDAGFFYSETVRQYEGTNDTVAHSSRTTGLFGDMDM